MSGAQALMQGVELDNPRIMGQLAVSGHLQRFSLVDVREIAHQLGYRAL